MAETLKVSTIQVLCLKPNGVLRVDASGIVPCGMVTFNALHQAHVHAKVKDDGSQGLKDAKGGGEANQVANDCLGRIDTTSRIFTESLLSCAFPPDRVKH